MTRPRLSDPHVIEHCQCLWEHGRLTRMYHKCPIHGTDSHDRSNTMSTLTVRLNADGLTLKDLAADLHRVANRLQDDDNRMFDGTDYHVICNDDGTPGATLEIADSDDRRTAYETLRGERRVGEFLFAVFAGEMWGGHGSEVWNDDDPAMPRLDGYTAHRQRELLKAFGITFNDIGDPVVVTDRDEQADAEDDQFWDNLEADA